MREVPDPQMFAVEYRVSCLPESHRMYKYLSLSVRRRGSKWVVEHMGDRGRYVSHTDEWQD